jgi:hypothetical protein
MGVLPPLPPSRRLPTRRIFSSGPKGTKKLHQKTYIKVLRKKIGRSPDEWQAMFKFIDENDRLPGVFAKASRKFGGVSKVTLWRRYQTRDTGSSRPGPPPVLGHDGEAALMKWIDEQVTIGNAMTREEIATTAKELCKELKLPGEVGGKKWMKRFWARHPTLSDRMAQLMESSRTKATSFEAVSRFFAHAKIAMLVGHADGPVDASCVYVMDETGIEALNAKEKRMVRVRLFSPPLWLILPPTLPSYTQQCVALRGTKHVFTPKKSTIKKHMTLVGCVSATGEVLCPTLLFEAAEADPRWVTGWPEARFAANESGYMDKDLFISWCQWFVTASGADKDTKRRVLFLDNHSSHLVSYAHQLLKDYNIHVVSFHPHTTHLYCVLDTSVFAQFKAKLYSLFSKTTGDVHFTELVNMSKTAYEGATKKEYDPATKEFSCAASKGFRNCGLVPFVEPKETDVKFKANKLYRKKMDEARAKAGEVVEVGDSKFILSEEERKEMLADSFEAGALQLKIAIPVLAGGKRAREGGRSELLTYGPAMAELAEKEEKAEKELEAKEARAAAAKDFRDKHMGMNKTQWEKHLAKEKAAKKAAEKDASAAAAAAAAAAAMVAPKPALPAPPAPAGKKKAALKASKKFAMKHKKGVGGNPYAKKYASAKKLRK